MNPTVKRLTTIWLVALALSLIPTSSAAPLHDAVAKGEIEVIRKLLADGADINAIDQTRAFPGFTPLHVSIYQNQDAAFQILLKAGASAVAPCSPSSISRGDTPLHLAVQVGNLAMVKTLVNAGVDVNIPGNSGDTPLITAARVGSKKNLLEIMKFLLSKGAVVDALDAPRKGFDRTTALLCAVSNENADAVKLLLDHGANPDIMLGSIRDAHTPREFALWKLKEQGQKSMAPIVSIFEKRNFTSAEAKIEYSAARRFDPGVKKVLKNLQLIDAALKQLLIENPKKDQFSFDDLLAQSAFKGHLRNITPVDKEDYRTLDLSRRTTEWKIKLSDGYIVTYSRAK